MSIMIDIIGSFIVVGMLILTILNVDVKMSDESYKSLTELKTQEELIQLGRIIEFDFYKAGYQRNRHGAMQIAESGRIKFRTNLYNVPGGKDSIEYDLGGYVTVTTNPYDRLLVRYENTTKVYINYSVTQFELSYYNRNDSLLTAPVTGAWLDSIKSVKVKLTLQSPEPFDTTRAGGYPYIAATYKKLIYPRNL